MTDGSGFMTGLALHQIKHEKQLLERQKDQLKSKVQKLKDEFTAEREKLNGVRYGLSVHVIYTPSWFHAVIQNFKFWDEGMQTDHYKGLKKATKGYLSCSQLIIHTS